MRPLGHSEDLDPITVVRDEGNLTPVKGKFVLVGPPMRRRRVLTPPRQRVPDLRMTVPGSLGLLYEEKGE